MLWNNRDGNGITGSFLEWRDQVFYQSHIKLSLKQPIIFHLCIFLPMVESWILFQLQMSLLWVCLLFYFILFYFILFYFILFYFILFCLFILFYFILFYFILFYFILFYFILFYFILFYFILFYYHCLFCIKKKL